MYRGARRMVRVFGSAGVLFAAVLTTFAAPTDGTLFFPHFVSGGGVSCEIVLLNQAGRSVNAELSFFDASGNPVDVLSAGEVFSHTNAVIPANGVYRLSLSPWGELRAGYAVVTPELGVDYLTGSLVLDMFDTQLSVPPSKPARKLWVAVDEGPGARTGLAFANPGTAPADLELRLLDAEGKVVRSRELRLKGREKVAEFVSEIFGSTPTFALGSVTASSSAVFSGLSLRQGTGGGISVIGWENGPNRTGLGTFGQVELQPDAVLEGTGENVDSVAFWDAPKPEDSLLFVTAKNNELLEVWKFPFTGNERAPIKSPFGDGMVNGVAVDQDLDLLFVSQARPSAKVYVFRLPEVTLWKTFSSLPLGDEPNLGIFKTESADHLLYVTDDHNVYAVDIESGAVLHSFRPPTSEIETVMGDSVAGVIYVPDEDERQGIYAFHWDGTPFERCADGNCSNLFGAGVFSKDAEGILLYKCPSLGVGDDGTGFIVVSDQRLSGTEFEVFDRSSWDHLGSFKIDGVTNTDGIGSTQRPLPGFPLGIFAAVDDDTATALVGWDKILTATGLSCEVEP